MLQRRRLSLAVLACAITVVLLAAAGVALAASPPGEHGSEGGLISLDKSLIVQVLNFLILLFLLHRVLYRPLLARMNERTAAIKASLDEAQTARAEAARQQQQNAEALRAAYAEAASIRAAALKEAAEEQRKLVDAARAEAHRLVQDAKAQLDTDVRRAREELRREVADLAIGAAEKLVRRSLRDDDHRRIVAEAVGRLSS